MCQYYTIQFNLPFSKSQFRNQLTLDEYDSSAKNVVLLVRSVSCKKNKMGAAILVEHTLVSDLGGMISGLHITPSLVIVYTVRETNTSKTFIH